MKVLMAPFDRSAERVEKAEIRQFFLEMIDSHRQMVAMYEADGRSNPREALREFRESLPESWAEGKCGCNPEHLTWFVLNELADRGYPEVSTDLWVKTLNHAADKQLAGDAAYDAIKTKNDSPYEKARFKALVADFSAAWQPRGGIEWSLIHQLAQSSVMYERWLKKHVDRMFFEGVDDHDLKVRAHVKGDRTWVVPRVTEAEAIEQAQVMADRFQKALLRIIRTLRDLRRYAPTVVIQNAEQVNLADQQINVQSH